jgi:signal transduction histidine kinase
MALDTQQWSTDPKRDVAAAIAHAQADLENAVEQLQRLPALDVQSIALAAHALTSFLSVTGAVVELLIPVLRDHPERQVGTWLEGLAHATSLMSHTVSELMNSSVGVAPTLRIEAVELPRLVERACAYHGPTAARTRVTIQFRADAEVGMIRTDRVLVAAVLDSLLTYAVKRAPEDTRVTVDLQPERGGVRAHVRDVGPGLSPSDIALLFAPPIRMEPSGGYRLAVAKRFVDLLGGEITCESTPGQGTTFSVWLPGVPPAADA